MIEMNEVGYKESLRQLLTQDHERLDRLFDALLEALRADAKDDAARLWAEFDAGLSAHMDLEEKHVLPALSAEEPREAAELRQEHEGIRAKLTELGVGVDLHLTRAETVSDFVELLRKHAQREDALAYQWAERKLSSSAQGTVHSRLRELLDAARHSVVRRGTALANHSATNLRGGHHG
jgi:hemerythrin-like domain-containing protein